MPRPAIPSLAPCIEPPPSLANGSVADSDESSRVSTQPTWDYLAQTQIEKLESHGVPGLGTSRAERESELGASRVRKILGVLEGALEDA
jgi:hypothetical protein